MYKYQGPDIEMANRQFERPKGMTEIMAVNLANMETNLATRCLDTNGAYDVLLGMDWLRNTNREAHFGTGEYRLGDVVCVLQEGRNVIRILDESSKKEDDNDNQDQLIAQ